MSEGFYVSIRNGRQTCLALGPYADEAEARANLDLARRLADRVDPWSGFYLFGTCKVTAPQLPTGRLHHLRTEPARGHAGLVDTYLHRHPSKQDDQPGAPAPARGPVPVTNPLYLLTANGAVYDGYRDGRPFTLVAALREVYGVAKATIYRLDHNGALVPVVRNAGSSVEVVHAPTGRRISRRLRRQRYGDQRSSGTARSLRTIDHQRHRADAASTRAAAPPTSTPVGSHPAAGTPRRLSPPDLSNGPAPPLRGR